MSDAQELKWHGWGTSDLSYHVGEYPGYKGIKLYIQRGSVADVVASFRSEQKAQEFMAWMDSLLDGRNS